MHLTLQQMKVFDAVARHSSFTRAAEEMYLTQPAISIQIKRLEHNVGLPLFEKIGKRNYLTEAGQEMHAACIDILQRLEDLNTAISSLQGEIKGRLRLSVVTTAEHFMPHLLGRFVQQYDQVEPSMVVTNRANLIERLNSNQDDLVIMGQVPDGMDMEAFPFLDNPLVVVANPKHDLAKEKSIPLERVVQERILVREPGSGTRMAISRVFESHKLDVNPFMELGSTEAIKQGTMAGLGLSILSRNNLRAELESGNLIPLDVEHFPLMRRWYVGYLKGKQLSRVASAFLAYLLDFHENANKNESPLGFDTRLLD
ncbi:MAG: LysR family transcriptional regulator [Pseudomonadota bacterium]